MREILSIHVGQTGNQIADRFWRLILKEHGLKPNGTPMGGNTTPPNVHQEVFFNRVRDGKFVPRAILVDLEPGVISRIEGGDMGELFDQGQIVKKLPGAANNWARGYHVEGERVIDQIMNLTIRMWLRFSARCAASLRRVASASRPLASPGNHKLSGSRSPSNHEELRAWP